MLLFHVVSVHVRGTETIFYFIFQFLILYVNFMYDGITGVLM